MPFQTRLSVDFEKKYPRQESNLVYNIRNVACLHHTPRMYSFAESGGEA